MSALIDPDFIAALDDYAASLELAARRLRAAAVVVRTPGAEASAVSAHLTAAAEALGRSQREGAVLGNYADVIDAEIQQRMRGRR